MVNIWSISLIILWVLVLVNLLLVLRVGHQQRVIGDLWLKSVGKEKLSELSIGLPPPDFRAKTLFNKEVSLADYNGQAVVFIFVSPHCGSCRRKIPLLVRLGSQAKRRANVEFLLVSDSGIDDTYNWVKTISEEDKVDINLQILVAPPALSEFISTYNPRGLLPYYCFLNEKGIVQSRDPLDMGEWPKLQQEWGDKTIIVSSFPPIYNRYR